MGPRGTAEYLAQMLGRYVRAQTRPEQGRLLTEAMAVTGYHRKALLPLWPPWVRKRLSLSKSVEAQVRAISARQMDRVLGPDKRRIRKRIYGGTKAGTLLKHHIPIKTDHWDVTDPGGAAERLDKGWQQGYSTTTSLLALKRLSSDAHAQRAFRRPRRLTPQGCTHTGPLDLRERSPS